MNTYNKMYKTTHHELLETMGYKSKNNLYSFKVLKAFMNINSFLHPGQ